MSLAPTEVEKVKAPLFESWECRPRVRYIPRIANKDGRVYPYKETSFLIDIPQEIARFLRLKKVEKLQVAIRVLPESPESQSQAHHLVSPDRVAGATSSRVVDVNNPPPSDANCAPEGSAIIGDRQYGPPSKCIRQRSTRGAGKIASVRNGAKAGAGTIPQATTANEASRAVEALGTMAHERLGTGNTHQPSHFPAKHSTFRDRDTS